MNKNILILAAVIFCNTGIAMNKSSDAIETDERKLSPQRRFLMPVPDSNGYSPIIYNPDPPLQIIFRALWNSAPNIPQESPISPEKESKGL